MKKTHFYKDKPLFGIDIRPDSVRLMQTVTRGSQRIIKGYGLGALDPNAVKDGSVVNADAVAKTIKQVLDSGLQGNISTRRVALSIPAARTFCRAIKLPVLGDQELRDAVMLEIEEYTPVPIDSLYVDFTPINVTPTEIEVFAVAAPRQVVDSYLRVAELLNLEPVLVETRVDSIKRLFAMTKFGNIPSVLIDFDKDTVDISIIDKNIIATGTVSIGSNFSLQIAEKLRSTTSGQNEKSANPGGLGLDPGPEPGEQPANENQLQQFIKEIRRMVRYYEERYDKAHQIEQIVLFGNESMLPGLVALMTDQLRLPVRSSDLWQLFSFDSDVAPIPEANGSDFIAVAGLSTAPHKQVFL